MATHIYQMAINYNVGGQFASNILHFTFDDSGFTTTAGAAKGLCSGWDAANRTALKNMLSAHVTLLSLRARALNIVGGFEGSLTFPAGQVGNRSGNLMAAGTGPCIILYPNGNDRHRGRIFLPGISDGDMIDGIYTGAYITAVKTAMTTLITPFNTVGGGPVLVQPVVYSRRTLTALNIAASQMSPMGAQVRRRQLPT